MKITLSIIELEKIIEAAKENALKSKDMSEYVEIEVIKERKYHLDSDVVKVRQLSVYAECNSTVIFKN